MAALCLAKDVFLTQKLFANSILQTEKKQKTNVYLQDYSTRFLTLKKNDRTTVVRANKKVYCD